MGRISYRKKNVINEEARQRARDKKKKENDIKLKKESTVKKKKETALKFKKQQAQQQIHYKQLMDKKKTDKIKNLRVKEKNKTITPEGKDILKMEDTRHIINLKSICDKDPYNYEYANSVLYKKIRFDLSHYDIHFIVPARGRKNFSLPLFRSVINAKHHLDITSYPKNINVQLTLIEDSEIKEHEDLCNSFGINYLHLTPQLHGDNREAPDKKFFNKCAAYNLAVLNTPPSDWYVFHDLDCVVQKDFFVNLLENINKKENIEAIQSFYGRRVLYLNQKLTNSIVAGELDVDSLTIKTPGVSLPEHIGAPGGSITVKRDLFFKIGGFDPEYFHSYAPEDRFFWEKLSCYTKVATCNDPRTEIFHLNHPILHRSNPFFSEMNKINQHFNDLSPHKQKEFIEYKRDKLPIKKKYEFNLFNL